MTSITSGTAASTTNTYSSATTTSTTSTYSSASASSTTSSSSSSSSSTISTLATNTINPADVPQNCVLSKIKFPSFFKHYKDRFDEINLTYKKIIEPLMNKLEECGNLSSKFIRETAELSERIFPTDFDYSNFVLSTKKDLKQFASVNRIALGMLGILNQEIEFYAQTTIPYDCDRNIVLERLTLQQTQLNKKRDSILTVIESLQSRIRSLDDKVTEHLNEVWKKTNGGLFTTLVSSVARTAAWATGTIQNAELSDFDPDLTKQILDSWITESTNLDDLSSSDDLPALEEQDDNHKDNYGSIDASQSSSSSSSSSSYATAAASSNDSSSIPLAKKRKPN